MRFLAAVAWLFVSLPALAGQVVVDFLDVGQGDAILIRGAGKTVLIDAGDRGSAVVAQLRALEVTRLDLVVGTHPHADHIGEMAAVLRNFPVGLYLDNGMPHETATYDNVMKELEQKGIPYRPARAGMQLKLGDEAVFHVLNPAEAPIVGTRSDLNSNSVVLWLEHGEIDFLFTGDSEEPTERALMSRGAPDVEVLKVAHHGSAHSTTSAFLAAVRPEQAVISVGANNRYDHPSDETIQRLLAAGALVFRTDLSHNVRAISNGAVVDLLEGTLTELGATPPVMLTRAAVVAKAPVAVPEPEPKGKKPKRGRKKKKVQGTSPGTSGVVEAP